MLPLLGVDLTLDSMQEKKQKILQLLEFQIQFQMMVFKQIRISKKAMLLQFKNFL
jgi:hypothetical protein